jgi:uncharacterized protein
MNFQMKYLWAKILLLFSLVLAFQAYSKELPKPPVPFRMVIDQAGWLDAGQENILEAKLRTFNDSTSTQIVVYIDASLEGEDVFDYSQRLAESWGIGQKGKDNGALLYIAAQERKLFIQVGYGLEAVIPDAASKKIIDAVLLPAFKKGAYFEGIDKATSVMMSLANQEFTAAEFVKKSSGKAKGAIGTIIIILIILFFVLRRTGFMGGLLMGSMWGSFSHGSGSFGGGGFSGGSFGGGSFGGGGAGGSW